MLVVAIGLAGVKRSGIFSQPLFALVLADILESIFIYGQVCRHCRFKDISYSLRVACSCLA
jgi:hypothetical protein